MQRPLPDTLVVGLGHTGLQLAESLMAHGARVVGTTRAPERAAGLRARGVDARVAELERPETLVGLCPEGGGVIYTAPPVLDAAGRDLGVRHLLEAVAPARPGVLVYYSTTGVYLESEGGVVTEESAVDADDARATPRLDAEAAVLEAAARLGATGIVFRLAGLYGHGRGLAARLAAGRVRLWGGGHNVLNRIHVDDVVRFTEAALISGPDRSGIYNLADDRPAPLREVALWLAERLGVPAPPEAPLEDAPSPTLTGSKRVSNLKARTTFGLELLAPSYVEGFERD